MSPPVRQPADAGPNLGRADGELAAQFLANNDGTAVKSEWDTTDVEGWTARQTVVNAVQQVVSTTTLNRDGTAQISFGPGASDLVLTNTDGDLGFVNNDGAAGGSAAFQLSPGDIVKPLPGGGLQWVPGLGAFASGPGAFIFGMTANSTAANPVEYQSLSADVRLKSGPRPPPSSSKPPPAPGRLCLTSPSCVAPAAS